MNLVNKAYPTENTPCKAKLLQTSSTISWEAYPITTGNANLAMISVHAAKFRVFLEFFVIHTKQAKQVYCAMSQLAVKALCKYSQVNSPPLAFTTNIKKWDNKASAVAHPRPVPNIRTFLSPTRSMRQSKTIWIASMSRTPTASWITSVVSDHSSVTGTKLA